VPRKKNLPANTPPPAASEDAARSAWQIAAQAAEAKKAIDLVVLDLREVSGFTDWFVICSGANSRQIQAIADEVELQLKRQGRSPMGVEGYEHAEWILADYGDFIVHIFSQAARAYYDLERLWRHAKPAPAEF
jgi:ribosome-associated protein